MQLSQAILLQCLDSIKPKTKMKGTWQPKIIESQSPGERNHSSAETTQENGFKTTERERKRARERRYYMAWTLYLLLTILYLGQPCTRPLMLRHLWLYSVPCIHLHCLGTTWSCSLMAGVLSCSLTATCLSFLYLKHYIIKPYDEEELNAWLGSPS